VNGKWTVTRDAIAPIHTFTAPEEGWLVTSHIIELPTQLFGVDAQYRLSCARQVARYAAELRKPLSRLYVTHYHPDHLFGAAEFAAPLFALNSVADKIEAAGDRVAREEREKIGDDSPPTARRVDRRIDVGEELIDGVRIEYRRLRCAETEDALIVALPDASAIIVQDLVYNRAHAFLGERRLDGWREALRQYRELPYVVVLPGHGMPGGKALYDEMIDYLDFAEGALAESDSAAQFKQLLLRQYPDHGGGEVLDHQLRFLFP
jgi:glyoxylase-like metal-dependent hydrolase (beta-lactamase superfamily II)